MGSERIMKLVSLLLAVLLLLGGLQLVYAQGALNRAEAEFQETARQMQMAIDDNEKDMYSGLICCACSCMLGQVMILFKIGCKALSVTCGDSSPKGRTRGVRNYIRNGAYRCRYAPLTVLLPPAQHGGEPFGFK